MIFFNSLEKLQIDNLFKVKYLLQNTLKTNKAVFTFAFSVYRFNKTSRK